MRILVAVASRHGGTQGIASRLTSELRRRGHDVDLHRIDQHDTGPHHDPEIPDTYDGYVVGSAVYADAWMKSGRRFLHDHLVQLRSRPLWLFSSGPLGDQLGGTQRPDEFGTLAGAREHHVFGGRMFRRELGPVERVVAAAVHAPEGDFRDWHDVDVWAAHIDDELRELTAAHA